MSFILGWACLLPGVYDGVLSAPGLPDLVPDCRLEGQADGLPTRELRPAGASLRRQRLLEARPAAQGRMLPGPGDEVSVLAAAAELPRLRRCGLVWLPPAGGELVVGGYPVGRLVLPAAMLQVRLPPP